MSVSSDNGEKNEIKTIDEWLVLTLSGSRRALFFFLWFLLESSDHKSR